ncbi:OsmC family protein [Thermus thermophilus]|uniref:OsmC family protein n=1 Tax=Thermus thermophilus TaxID=274 RepID=UPI001161F561|nr:OsmC family protein [Thermus thermophilus]BBL82432.1 oxidoreductase [Thermus thermophilus]BBL84733.1 oxidoreductase [Thermus thermophilus]BCZ94646.1 oxidoreductase [Thermus thermophilus]
MAATVRVELSQLGPSTSEGVVRGKHRILVDRPVEKGGEDRGAMGGELLLVALGGCFLSNLLAAIRAREAPIQEVRVVVEGTLAEAPPRYRQIRMEVQARTEDRALLEKLVTMAERACIVANTLRGGVDLEVRVV